jgi:hypothetical protein
MRIMQSKAINQNLAEMVCKNICEKSLVEGTLCELTRMERNTVVDVTFSFFIMVTFVIVVAFSYGSNHRRN